jgi:hypothetical protein
MRLSDLPTMLVERIDRTAGEMKVHGQFDRLEGVRESGYFRLERCVYAWATLRFTENTPGGVEFSDARDGDVSKLQVGQRYTWLDDYFQAPLVEAIADESTAWRPATFHPRDAQYFRQGESIGWRPVGQPIPDDAVALDVRPGGWDHEHCDLCFRQIDLQAPTYYTDPEDHLLCPNCYERYGRPHDVSFQVGS